MQSLLPILLGILVLLGFSAFFSGSETALMSLTKAQLRRMQNGPSSRRLVTRLLKDSQRTLGTILLGNLFVNTLLTALAAELLSRSLSSPVLGAVCSIAVVTPVLILFGELLPKANGLRFNTAIACASAPMLTFLSWLFAPVLWCLTRISAFFQRLFGIADDGASWELLTNAEMLSAIDSAASSGASSHREHELLERILRFGTVEAKEIMVPRPNLFGIDDSLSLNEAFPAAQASGFSLLPVYHGDLDETWGVIAFTDFLRFHGTPLAERPLAAFRWSVESGKSSTVKIPVSPLEFIPATAGIDRLLETMRRKSCRMAIVVSEYGGTLGMVTRAMILEEIVGRYAFSGRDVNKLQPHHGGFLADGRARLRMVSEALECEFEESETETLAGFVMERLGRIPQAGDSFQENGYRFLVVRTAGKLASAVIINPVTPEIPGRGAAC